MIVLWRILGKRMRARGRLETAIARLPFAMGRTIARCGRMDLAQWASRPEAARNLAFCVHLHLSDKADRSWGKDAIKALARQSHAPIRIFVTGDQAAAASLSRYDRVVVLDNPCASRIEGLAAALTEAQAEGAHWLVPCAVGCTLIPHALIAYGAQALARTKGHQAAVMYGDTREHGTGPLGAARRLYWLKPQWDQRMFLSQDYVTDGCALAVGPALQALTADSSGAPSTLYELVLQLSEHGVIEHCPRVVAQTAPETWCKPDGGRRQAIQSTLDHRGLVEPGPYGTSAVRWSLPAALPKVTVIVATRDRLELLRTCVEGVLGATHYDALDLIIADNDSVEPETLSYMEEMAADPRVHVVRWPHPFNYSAINNFAARHATGEYLCLLNNDIEVIEPQWLTEMMREAIQPGVGAVGARLLYPDRSIQHAGVAIGIGNAAGHAHRGLCEGEPGYFAQALIARGASAVTGACLVVAKAHFDEVGGLDEESLAVAYNDVDLCLKLRERGLTNIYTPLATLIHHESKSRGLDFAPEHLERYMRELKVFQDRWHTTRAVDPWHHPLLARGSEVYC